MLKVDSREPESQFKRLDRMEVKYEKIELPVGDFLYEDKNLVFERKTANDFWNSFRSGRLQKQLLQMNSFKFPYLIIVGNWKDLFFKKVYITKNQLAGILASINVRYKVKIIQVENENMAIRIMEKIYEKTEDGKTVGLIETDLLRSQIKTDDIYLKMLSCVPGISIKKGQKILEDYKFKELFLIKAEKLQTIKGIGKKLSEKIKEIFD